LQVKQIKAAITNTVVPHLSLRRPRTHPSQTKNSHDPKPHGVAENT